MVRVGAKSPQKAVFPFRAGRDTVWRNMALFVGVAPAAAAAARDGAEWPRAAVSPRPGG